MLRSIFLVLLLVGCSSTKPTPYQKDKKKEGFSDHSFEDLRAVTFKGNSYTKKKRAQDYAEFRALENCLHVGAKHANLIDVFDKTVQKEITRSSGNAWGPSYYGMYPAYSRYSGFGFGVGMSTTSGQSWKETLVFPIIEVLYTCEDSVVRPGLMLKEVEAEEMKLLVKDLRGSLQIIKVTEKSPNRGVVENGDIILRVNGKRVERVYELIRLFTRSATEIKVEVLRDGKRLNLSLRSQDITEEVGKTEAALIHRVCGKMDKKGLNNLCPRRP